VRPTKMRRFASHENHVELFIVILIIFLDLIEVNYKTGKEIRTIYASVLITSFQC